MTNTIALITGATSGIGQATAELLSKNGYDLILVARRENLLNQIKTKLESETSARIHPVILDIRNEQAVSTAISSLPEEWKNISVLINNAGMAKGRGKIEDGLPEDWDETIDTNIKGLLYISKHVIPLIQKQVKGHIINIGSIVGKDSPGGSNVYGATKFAVDGINDGMRIDLLPDNIRVTQVRPGTVKTGFALVAVKGDEELARKKYEGYSPLKPTDIAEVILFTLKEPEHVNINDVLVMPKLEANVTDEIVEVIDEGKVDYRIVMITGATSGIGEASARKYAENGYDLILTGRRNDRLEKLANDLQQEFQIKSLPLCFDVRDSNAVSNAIDSLPEEWKQIDVLINNAGLAVGKGSVEEGVVDDWDRMIDTNIKGLLYVTRKVVKLMKGRKKGHVVNIGSIAGKQAYQDGNVYCGTKYAVDALTKAMRIEFLSYHIGVTSVCPGAVRTEFSLVRFKGDQDKADGTYKGFKPLTAQDVAESIYFSTSRPNHVNINDLIIMPTAQATPFHFHKT